MTDTPTLPTGTPTPPPVGGAHHRKPQSGILNRPTEHLILASLAISGEAPAQSVEGLRQILKSELTSTLQPDADASVAQPETGELGYEMHHDRAHLTVTVGFALSAYEKLGVPSENRPADLTAVPQDVLGDKPESSDGGDLVVQICSDDPLVAEHVLRQIEHNLPGLSVLWAHTGVQRYTSRQGRVAKREARGWIGFLDGTSNLDPAHNDEDYSLTFVDPDAVDGYPEPPTSGPTDQYGGQGPAKFPDLRRFDGPEPPWTRDGSYMCVRISATDLAAWDHSSLTGQEQSIGRRKQDGVSLDLAGVADATADSTPDFAANPSNTAVALDAHIRKANPRRAGDQLRRIFRRGYPLYEGGNGPIRRGLIFISYARTISTQFEFIFRAWLNNPNFPRPDAGVDRLRLFESAVLTGGYYFVPPLENARQPWSWHVPIP